MQKQKPNKKAKAEKKATINSISNNKNCTKMSKAKYDSMRQIDWSYIDGPIKWD